MLSYLVKQLKVHPPLHVPLDSGETRIESRYGTSTVSSSVKIDKTSALGDNVRVGEQSRIGILVLILSNIPDGTSIGDCSVIDKSVLFNPESGGITICEGVIINTGARIKGDVFIGHHTSIGAAEIGLGVHIGDDVHIDSGVKIPNGSAIASHMFVVRGLNGTYIETPVPKERWYKN